MNTPTNHTGPFAPALLKNPRTLDLAKIVHTTELHNTHPELETIIGDHQTSRADTSKCKCGYRFPIPNRLHKNRHLADMIEAAGWRQIP